MSNLMAKVRKLDDVRRALREVKEQYKYCSWGVGAAYRTKISDLEAKEKTLLAEIDALVLTEIEPPATKDQQDTA